jgi:hypothetical protein
MVPDNVQPEPPVTVTVKLKGPPVAGTDAEFDGSEYEHVEEPVIVKDVAPNWRLPSKM